MSEILKSKLKVSILTLLIMSTMFVAVSTPIQFRQYKKQSESQAQAYKETIIELNDTIRELQATIKNNWAEIEGLNKKLEVLEVELSNRETEVQQLLIQVTRAKSLEQSKLTSTVSRGGDRVFRYIPIKATAYDLTVASTGKSKSHPQYGLTATGYNLRGKDWTTRVVAVDPKFIPLKKYIKVEFEAPEYQYLNGWWYTADTGSAVKGNKVDFYLGEGSSELTKQIKRFGIKQAKIIAISDKPEEI